LSALPRSIPDGTNAGTVGYLSGAVSLQNNDPQTAEKFFGIMIEKQPNSPYREDMTMLLGHAKFMQGRWEDARKDYETYLQKYGNGSNKEEVTYRLACIDVFTGKYEDALKRLDVYVTAFPKGDFVPDAKYREAVCYYAAEKYEDVINKCDVWQVKFPKDPLTGEVLSLMGDAYGAQNKHEQAARAYERSTKEASSDEVLVYSLFEASKQMQKAGMWEPMTAMFEEFVKNNPEHQAAVAGLYWIGRAKAKLGKTEEAKTFLIEQTRKYINEPKREAVESLLTQVAQLCLKPPPPPPEPPKAKLPPVQQPVVTGAINVSAASPVAAEPAPATPPERPPWDPFAEYDRLTAPLLENAQPIAKARVLFGRGELFEMKRQPDKKQELLAQISKEFKPEDFSPILLGRVGDYRKDQGNIDGARALYEKLKEDFPQERVPRLCVHRIG
jgi:TolA-binding protein